MSEKRRIAATLIRQDGEWFIEIVDGDNFVSFKPIGLSDAMKPALELLYHKRFPEVYEKVMKRAKAIAPILGKYHGVVDAPLTDDETKQLQAFLAFRQAEDAKEQAWTP